MIKKLSQKAYKLLKGEEFYLSEELSQSELIIFLWKRIVMLLRGLVFHRRKIFCGARVKISYSRKVSIGKFSTIGLNSDIQGLSKNGVHLGNSNNLGNGTIFKCTGVLTDLGVGIRLGDNVAMGSNSYLGGYGGIEIGSDSIIGERFTVHSDNHNFNRTDVPIRKQGTSKLPVKIGNDCWFGSNVTILGGVTVGKGCVIGAGTIVTKDIPDYSICVGNPARILKSRKNE